MPFVVYPTNCHLRLAIGSRKTIRFCSRLAQPVAIRKLFLDSGAFFARPIATIAALTNQPQCVG
jgi:hypothetical protein